MVKKSVKKTVKKPKGIIPSNMRGRGPRILSHTINKLTKSMLGRRGLTRGDIVSQWNDIIGPQKARHTSPEKIVFSKDGASGGVLHLRCDSGALSTQLLHQEPMIIDKINMFFGYQAIVRIKLIQAPLIRRSIPLKKSVRPLTATQLQNVKTATASVKDPEIREILERLGQSIHSRATQRHKPKT